MQTLTAPVWLLVVLGGLAVWGFVAGCWVAAGWAERAADWWHDRRELVDDPSDLDEYDPTGLELGSEIEALLGLPPERTWEQMTSHQLPLVGVVTPEPDLSLPWAWNAVPRERRVPWWQAEILGAYAALGLEGTGFTRAMAARVRELAP